jgi:hypothetical protein
MEAVEEISVSGLATRAGMSDGAVLVTRPYGRSFLAALDAIVRDRPEGALIVLSFSQISVMDGSFADQVFSTWASRRARRQGPSCLLLLQALPAHVEETLDITMRSRPDREPGLRNCVLPACTAAGRVDLLGKAEGHVRESFEQLRTRRRLTARDVAQTLQLDIHAASTRLKTLHTLGLARRTEAHEAHGKQYVYVWPF